MLLCWWRCRHRALLLVHSVLLMLRQDTTCHRRVRFHRREPPTRRPIHHRRSPASRNSAPLSPGSRWTAPTSLPADLAGPAAETHLSRCSTQLNGHPHYGLHWSSVRVSWSVSINQVYYFSSTLQARYYPLTPIPAHFIPIHTMFLRSLSDSPFLHWFIPILTLFPQRLTMVQKFRHLTSWTIRYYTIETKPLRAHCTSLTKWLTWRLTIWLSVDALQETLTLS